METWRRSLGYTAVVVSCTFASPSHALDSASAKEGTTLVVWFRGAEGCPDGSNFLDQLRERGVTARLAEAGDRVDFVVTLGLSQGVAAGRLERQTSSGTIAIRQVKGPECGGVANAIALTLALSHEPPTAADTIEPRPGTPLETPEEPPPQASVVEAPAAPSPLLDEAAPLATSKSATPPAARSQASTAAPSAPTKELLLSVGGNVAIWDVFQESVHLLGSPFLELDAPRAFILPNATARVALYGGFQPDPSAPTDVWLLGMRLEACPVGAALGVLVLRPCVAMDGGAVGASAAGTGDVGPWLAAEVHGRVAANLGWLGLEAQGGVVLPVTRYTVAAPTMTLESANAIGFAAAFGIKYPFR